MHTWPIQCSPACARGNARDPAPHLVRSTIPHAHSLPQTTVIPSHIVHSHVAVSMACIGTSKCVIFWHLFSVLVANEKRHEVVLESDDAVLSVVIHGRSEEHTSELQSLMRISYAVFCLK